MGLFSRRRNPSAAEQQAAIDDFWSWWTATGAAHVAAAIEAKHPQGQEEPLGTRIASIHPSLAWELGPSLVGAPGVHSLTVTSEGNPDLRAIAARWLRAAPRTDNGWEFYSARQPSSDLATVVLEIDGRRIAAAQAAVGARVRGALVDVSVYHPEFSSLGEQQRRMAVFLLLDAALGEVAVETWIGEISDTEHPIPDSIPLSYLSAVTDEVAHSSRDENGNPHWYVAEGKDPAGNQVLVSAQVILRSVIAPQFDTHVAVVVPYRDLTGNGWPGPGSLDALRSFEEHLCERLGSSGTLVAHQSAAGVRVLHFFTDSTTPAAEQLKAAVIGWDQGTVQVQVTRDPSWDQVAHLRA